QPLRGGRGRRRVVGGVGVLGRGGGGDGGRVGDRPGRCRVDVHDDREGLAGAGGQRAEGAGHGRGYVGAARGRDEAHLRRQHIGHRAAAGGGRAVVGHGEGVGDVRAGGGGARRALRDRQIGQPLRGGRRRGRVVRGVGVLGRGGGGDGGRVGDRPGRCRVDVHDDREGLGGAGRQGAEGAGHGARRVRAPGAGR